MVWLLVGRVRTTYKYRGDRGVRGGLRGRGRAGGPAALGQNGETVITITYDRH